MPEDKSLIESLCNLEIPSAIKLSPDCQKVLYSTELTWGHRKGKYPVSTLWIAETGEENSSHRLTSGISKDYAPAWSPDGKSIAFISDRAQVGEKWAIYVLPRLENAKAYPIIAEDNERSIEAFEFSPNGKQIAFLSSDEKTSAEVYREQNGENIQVWGESWAYARLRIVDVETRNVRSLNLDRHVTDLCWNPNNGKEIAFISCKTPFLEDRFLYDSLLSTVDIDLMEPTTLCKLPMAGNIPLLWADNGQLYLCGDVPLGKYCCGHGVYTVDPALESPFLDKVAFGIDDDVSGLGKANGEIIAKIDHRLEHRISLLSGKVLWTQDTAIEAFDVGFDRNHDELVLTFATSNVNRPVEVLSTKIGNRAVIQLSNHGQAFNERPFGNCSALPHQSADNKVELDSIYLTPSGNWLTESSQPRKPLPTIVMIHGGPNTHITNAFNTYYYYWTPYLLSFGYGILIPNYRGSSGRGSEFASYSIDGVGNYDHADIISATQNAIDKGYADKGNLIVAGWSQGGMLTFLCSMRNGLHGHGWRFKAAIAGAGISDSDSMALTSDLGAVYQPEMNNGRVTWNMSRDDTRNRKASPLWEFNEAWERSVRKGVMVVPPMLILHGEKDERCPLSQAWGMRRALQSRELPYEFVMYPRQGHFFSEQKFWIDMALRIGRWCERYIGSGSGGDGK